MNTIDKILNPLLYHLESIEQPIKLIKLVCRQTNIEHTMRLRAYTNITTTPCEGLRIASVKLLPLKWYLI